MTDPAPDPLADLDEAARIADLASSVVTDAVRHIATHGGIDANQAVAYDLAHSASAVRVALSAIDFGRRSGEDEAAVACAFTADVVADLFSRIWGRENAWGARAESLVSPESLLPIRRFTSLYRNPSFLESTWEMKADRKLGEEYELARETFHRFAEERIRPLAEQVHRRNEDVPEEIISALAELGGFGLSVPESYGGFATGSEGDYLGMVIATEELSWGSLGVGGSLITRPEILTRALVAGGTEEQKRRWLPKIASGEQMVAVAVTEPDYGSDVAGITCAARKVERGWLVSGVKTWCTFAARADLLMLLARTDSDRAKGHRGLSLFVVEKSRADGSGFLLSQAAGSSLGGDAGNASGDTAGNTADGTFGSAPAGSGRLEGRPIDTIGYRGMHSYELSFDEWLVPDDCLVGGDAGVGKGFYLQMQGFENGRLQTAARALGVMQAAYDEGVSYAAGRKVFGRPIIDYQLTRVKLARMSTIIQATRQFAYAVARMMAAGDGALEASMVKAYACKAAEWVTREAMQIHGGMGYAEEFPVSRYFVDARVLSIFEGADETLALKVIARRLLEQATSQ